MRRPDHIKEAMRNTTPRTFTFCLLNLLLVAAIGLAGCPGWADEKSADDLGLGDDDSAAPPSDDDSAADDDDSTPPLPDDDDATEPADDDDAAQNDPCDGIDREEDFDCDGVPNAEPADVFLTDPDAPRVLFRKSTVGWTSSSSNISVVGSGFGGEDDWSFLELPPSSQGSWWQVNLQPGVYRLTLRGPSDSQWADFNDYCETSGDPACMLDEGCQIYDIPAGWAMAVSVTETASWPASEDERDEIDLAEEDCPTVI